MPSADPVGRRETLARFVVFSTWIKAGHAKVDAFMPDPSRTLSVFRIDGLAPAKVKKINNAVDKARRKKLVNYGYCPLNAGQVLDRDFSLDPNNEPAFHVNIGNFGTDLAAHRAKAILLKQIAAPLVNDHLK